MNGVSPIVTYETPSLVQKLQEVHSLMASHDTAIPDRLAPVKNKKGTQTGLHKNQGSPLQWFISNKKTQRLWDQVNGRAIYIVLNPATQALKLLCIALCVVYLCLESLASKRQMRFQLRDAVSHIRDLYGAPLVFFSTAIFVQAFGLNFTVAPSALIDVFPSSFYGATFIATFFEAATMRWSRRIRLFVCICILSIVAVAFWKRARFNYGHLALTKADCEVSGLLMDCHRFPAPAPDENDLGKVSSATASTMSIAYVELPGDISPFRYTVGEEEQAVEQVATLQRAAYSKVASKITGAERYHQAIHTPGPENEEIEKVQTQVREHALERTQKWLEEAEEKRRAKDQEHEGQKAVEQEQSDEEQQRIEDRG